MREIFAKIGIIFLEENTEFLTEHGLSPPVLQALPLDQRSHDD
jgi:hypothetical protein